MDIRAAGIKICFIWTLAGNNSAMKRIHLQRHTEQDLNPNDTFRRLHFHKFQRPRNRQQGVNAMSSAAGQRQRERDSALFLMDVPYKTFTGRERN